MTVAVDYLPPPCQQATKPLARRHLQVLALIADGLTGPEIARRLFIAESTVKAHADEAMRRLKARTRAHAVALAFRTGVLS